MGWRAEAIADIRRDESCRLYSYQDGEGVWTIGYGHTAGVEPLDVCTLVQAGAWLESDFGIAEFDLNSFAPWWSEMPDAARRGLVNMSYNLGWARLSQFKKMLFALKSGDWLEASKQALDSKWASQVGDRALRIAGLFNACVEM